MGYEAEIRLFDPAKGLSYDLGLVSRISRSYSANITQKSVVIYGYSNALCIDTGVSKTYTLDFTRVSPYPPNATSQVDTSQWSNARWLASLKDSLNRWQVDSDGFRLSITMDPEMKDLYPDIDGENVYVTNISLPRSNVSSQVVSGSVTLQVGSLTQSDIDVPDTVPLTFQAGYSTDSFYVAMPLGSKYTIPQPKTSWTDEQYSSFNQFRQWMDSDGNPYSPGDIITVTQSMVFTAQWVAGTATAITKDYSGSYTGQYTFKTTTVTAQVFLFGAGGGGGSGRDGAGIFTNFLGGGGGGGGGLDIVELETRETASISYTLGQGGSSGNAGGDTFISGYSGRGLGGQAGGDAGDQTVGSGGEGGMSAFQGGQGGRGGQNLAGNVTPAMSGEGLYGGEPGKYDKDTLPPGPGGGGGSVATGGYEGLIQSSGISPSGGRGAGYIMSDGEPSTAGAYGCGGGGGNGSSLASDREGPSAGGDGFIIIIEFEG